MVNLTVRRPPTFLIYLPIRKIYILHNHVIADSIKLTLNPPLLDKSCEHYLHTVDQISPLDQFLLYISHYKRIEFIKKETFTCLCSSILHLLHGHVQLWYYWTLFSFWRGSVVGWGTMLQARRRQVRVPMRWIIFNFRNPSSCTIAVGSTQPLTEMSTRNLPGG
jgi:hypothetical protein